MFFRVAEQIHISGVQEQVHEYFVLLVIGNVTDPLLISLTVSPLNHLSDGDTDKATEINCSHERVRSDMIAKATKRLIYKNIS